MPERLLRRYKIHVSFSRGLVSKVFLIELIGSLSSLVDFFFVVRCQAPADNKMYNPEKVLSCAVFTVTCYRRQVPSQLRFEPLVSRTGSRLTNQSATPSPPVSLKLPNQSQRRFLSLSDRGTCRCFLPISNSQRYRCFLSNSQCPTFEIVSFKLPARRQIYFR